MATSTKGKDTTKTKVPFKLHPRVFSSLGGDLVTNDFVAITELVKNSYDAGASSVTIRIDKDPQKGQFIEIEDDGSGMTEQTVRDVWCLVATPHRVTKSIATVGKKKRRASGEKGLGRLSMARLGDRLEMVTKARGKSCLRIDVHWPSLSSAESLEQCEVELDTNVDEPPFKDRGTRLRIFDLHNEWDDTRRTELHDHLARLIPPFKKVKGFQVRLTSTEGAGALTTVTSPTFLNKPKYSLKGRYKKDGSVSATYDYKPISQNKQGRTTSIELAWGDIQERAKDKHVKGVAAPSCGAFSFEFRAWDIAVEDVQEISERFRTPKNNVRNDIKAHKGVSVYRDDILVLPKSEGARDWLGLDIRRVSEIGLRLSTSQVIGIVSITAKGNPNIKDTSDRERLVGGLPVTEFEEMIRIAINLMEEQRDKDKLDTRQAERKLLDLFTNTAAEELSKTVTEVAHRNGSAAEILPLVSGFRKELEKERKELERRFVYYSRLATVGTLAQMLVHEVRNKTTVIGDAIEALRESTAFHDLPDGLKRKLDRASDSTDGLDRLAETFAPLASRNFGRAKRTSLLEERIQGTLGILQPRIAQNKINVTFAANQVTVVSVDPGELDSVLWNVLDNAVHWLSKQSSARELDIRIRRLRGSGRVQVAIHDSGPGIKEEDAERVFWPGVTSKPDGIGMGLTIAAEIIDAHEGKMGLMKPPTELGGASFEFDLPVAVSKT